MTESAVASGATTPAESFGEVSEFAKLLKQEFRTKTDEDQKEVEAAVRILAREALKSATVVPTEAIKSIEAIIAEIDRTLEKQLNHVLHEPEFQKLEGTWRGLYHLVSNTQTDEMLKIRIFDLSKDELSKTLKKFKGTAWDQSPVFKKVYEEEYGQLGGKPYGCLIGDYQFDHGAQDVETLGEMARIAAAAHAPFIASASPAVFRMESWRELGNPRDLSKIFESPAHIEWRKLRESEDSRYIGLTMPRFLARRPYGKDNPVDGFVFREDTNSGDESKYTWSNSAYALGVNINRSFKTNGWVSRIHGIESGGTVEDLPIDRFPTDDNGVDLKCPTEIAISDRREAELAKNGFIPLVHMKDTNLAAFMSAQSMQRPAVYDNAEATSNAVLAARLPYLFASCRFAHYLKCIVRDKVGSFKERRDMERWLTEWITNYVDGDPANSAESTKAQKPLAAAEVAISEIEGNPGYYNAVFYLRPHYQLEGLTVSLRLVSRLPSERKR